MEDVFNRFFAGEAVLLQEMKDAVGQENVPTLLVVLNVGHLTSMVDTLYLVGGQRRQMTTRGLAFYGLIKGLFEAGEEE